MYVHEAAHTKMYEGTQVQAFRLFWCATFFLPRVLRRDFLASVGITYAVFRIAKLRLRVFGASC